MSKASYEAYLASDHWQKLRAFVLSRDSGRCRSCGGRATEVHHQDYSREVMIGMRHDKLFSLCRLCHEAITFDIFGLKRPQSEVAEITSQLAPLPARPKGRHRKGKRKSKCPRCGRNKKKNKTHCRVCKPF